MSWTDERIDRPKSLWLQGMTASQIAEDLGGVSRNAVIGKAHRLGLQSRPSPVKPNEEGTEPGAEAESAPWEEPAAPEPARAASAPEAAPEPAAAAPAQPPAPPQPQVRSIGPGGFIRQAPGEQQAPIPPAPPRRLVP